MPLPLPLTHKEGSVVGMYYQNRLVAMLKVIEILKIGRKNKQVRFIFKGHANNTPAAEYTLSEQRRAKPMADSSFPMNQLEIRVNQHKRCSGKQVSLHYQAPIYLRIERIPL